MKNKAFAEYVTSASFHLTLSKAMIGTMVMVKTMDTGKSARYTYHGGRDNWSQSFTALKSRGLVEHNPLVSMKDGGTDLKTDWSKVTWIFRLTEAGEKVFELLEIAGLVEDTGKVGTEDEDFIKTMKHQQKLRERS